ncbi:MAG: ankyrin repeat domain-containing protein [Planctomycetota bacterium]
MGVANTKLSNRIIEITRARPRELIVALFLVVVVLLILLKGFAQREAVSPTLFAAVNAGDLDAVLKLVGLHADVNEKDAWGQTALHRAAGGGSIPIESTRALVRKPLAKMVNFATCAHIAQVLIDAGADVNARSDSNWTPLHFAVFAGNTQVAKVLIGNGAHVDPRDGTGLTPLHMAVVEAVFSGSSGMVNLLLESGAGPNVRDNLGETAADIVKDLMVSKELNSPQRARCERILELLE